MNLVVFGVVIPPMWLITKYANVWQAVCGNTPKSKYYCCCCVVSHDYMSIYSKIKVLFSPFRVVLLCLTIDYVCGGLYSSQIRKCCTISLLFDMIWLFWVLFIILVQFLLLSFLCATNTSARGTLRSPSSSKAQTVNLGLCRPQHGNAVTCYILCLCLSVGRIITFTQVIQFLGHRQSL